MKKSFWFINTYLMLKTIVFFKYGPTSASFWFIFGLIKHTIQFLQQINVKKCHVQDSNPQPLEHELPPMTTRPGLLPLLLKVVSSRWQCFTVMTSQWKNFWVACANWFNLCTFFYLKSLMLWLMQQPRATVFIANFAKLFTPRRWNFLMKQSGIAVSRKPVDLSKIFLEIRNKLTQERAEQSYLVLFSHKLALNI